MVLVACVPGITELFAPCLPTTHTQNSYLADLLLSVMEFGDGAFGSQLGLHKVMKVGLLRWDLCPYEKRHQRECSLCLSFSCIHIKKPREHPR